MKLAEFTRTRAFLWCAGAALLGAICVAIACSLPAAGRKVQGRPLLTWLQQLDANAGSQDLSRAAAVIRSLTAEQMEGLAELLERDWASSPDLSKRINVMLDPVFDLAGLHGHLFDDGNASTYCQLALKGLQLLGTNAAPIVPRLARDLQVWETSYAAASALSVIGGQALVPVVAILTNGAPSRLPYRWPLVCGLQAASTTDAQIVVPALVRALEDADPEVQIFATQGLKKFRGHEREFLPALLRNLESPISRVRGVTAEALGALGRKEAVPRLRLLLVDPDPDPNFRAAVKRALQDLERGTARE